MILFADEASLGVAPYVTHTYARRGGRARLEVSSGVTQRIYLASAISPEGRLYYHIRAKPFDAQAIVDFLCQLLQAFATEKLLIIWDNVSIHDCQATHQFLTQHSQAKRLHLIKQPTYSPELNADEQVWQHLKCVQLKNTCSRNVKELTDQAKQGMENIKSNPKLVTQFFHHPDLGFYN